MNSANHLDPTYKYVFFETQSIVAAAAQNATNTIQPGVKQVIVTGVTADANDFVVLPSMAKVPNGFQLVIEASAGANFELRTPASSNEKINNEDSDGTKEYLVTDTDHLLCVKKSTGWVVQSITNLGAVRTAVVPD